MNDLLIPVILVVKNHWLLGKLRTPDQRVLDNLNDPRTNYLDLVDVKVFSSIDRQNCLAELPAATVPKDGLYLLVIPTNKFDPSRNKRLHRFVEKKALWVNTVAAGYFIRGNLHVKSLDSDPRHTLTNVLGHFFPITDATLSGFGTEPISVKTVMANKTYVSCLSLERPHQPPHAAEVKLAVSDTPESDEKTPSAGALGAV